MKVRFNAKIILRIAMIILFIVIVILLISQAVKVGEQVTASTSEVEVEPRETKSPDAMVYWRLEYEVPDSVEDTEEATLEVVTDEIPTDATEAETVKPTVLGAYTEVETEIPEETEPVVTEPVEITPEEVTYEGYIPGDTGFRSYEPYTVIGHGSIQETILWYASPDENGLMCINGRPLVAIGTGWGYWLYSEITVYTDEGSYDCIVGDIKADVHTDWTNRVTSANGCVVEFIVDPWAMDPAVKGTGSISAIPKYHGYVTDIVKTGEVSLG